MYIIHHVDMVKKLNLICFQYKMYNSKMSKFIDYKIAKLKYKVKILI